MTIYLDTTCWYRSFERHKVQERISERNAILSILEENEKDNKEFKIVSCKMQINQIYSKWNSLDTDEVQKTLLRSIIASIKFHAGDSVSGNPYQVRQFLDEFLTSTDLPDVEDARHILTAWILRADYFLTTDYTTILNVNADHRIESFLDSRIHPILGTVGRSIKILSPVSGLAELERFRTGSGK